MSMQTYELRLIEADGQTIGLYSFECRDDERARASIFAMGDTPYARYEIWHGMEKISEGHRFICANGPFAAQAFMSRAAA
jgi:hypothetical protein